MSEKDFLSVDNLRISTAEAELVRGISFTLERGRTLGVVGESGSGKSLSSLAIMGLLPANLEINGSIYFKEQELVRLGADEHRQLRGKQMSMIFQEPMTSLNPTMQCGRQVTESLRLHLKLPPKEAYGRTIELFQKVKLPRPEAIFKSYPHQISGGQKQRVMIALSVACNPELLIADEPTTALDATVQLEILELLKELQQDYRMAMIFITHDLGVVKRVSDDLLVLHQGDMVEKGLAEDIINNPAEAYTRGLLACRPTFDTDYYRLHQVKDFSGEISAINFKRESKEAKLKRAMQLQGKPPLLEINDLSKVYQSTSWFNKEEKVKAVSKASFKIYKGESLGLVGESGSGKSTIGKMLTGLEGTSEGNIWFKGKDISHLSRKAWQKINRDIQVIFQDPFSSLNPRITVGAALRETISYHNIARGNGAKKEAQNLLLKTGLGGDSYFKYPHEFSGGQRQRIGIARALALKPEFIVCDEAVSALDVSVQAQILNLLNDLKEEYDFTYLFISHDLAVVKYFCDRIVVLKEGEIVETDFSDKIYDSTQNEYTQKLIAAAQL